MQVKFSGKLNPRIVMDDISEPKSAVLKASSDGPEILTVEQAYNHLYFYSSVDEDRGLALIKTLRQMVSGFRNEAMDRSLPPDQQTPIWLHICSGGGGLFAGLAIMDQIKAISSSYPIYSVVEGAVGSAATLISMACEKRFILPSSFMLIHQFSTWFFSGTYEQYKDEMELQDMQIEAMVDFYVRHSNLTHDDVRDMLKHDSWFNAEQCIEKGFVDGYMPVV